MFHHINSHTAFDSLFLSTAFEKDSNDLLIWKVHSALCLGHTFPAGTVLMVSKYSGSTRSYVLRDTSSLPFSRKPVDWSLASCIFLGHSIPRVTMLNANRCPVALWRDKRCCNQEGHLSEIQWSLLLNIWVCLEETEFCLIFFFSVA